MNRFFIGVLAGAAGIISGTYYYHTKIKKELDEKGVFQRSFFGGKFKVNIKNKNEDNNTTAEA